MRIIYLLYSMPARIALTGSACFLMCRTYSSGMMMLLDITRPLNRPLFGSFLYCYEPVHLRFPLICSSDSLGVAVSSFALHKEAGSSWFMAHSTQSRLVYLRLPHRSTSP
ncbi:hypothetical protein F4859DRAFT_489416 [Xylaria cf. heliscus]|nr:hypothetical protein F4859DRAFT_489416 [Xylaria cf. heliscus]